MRAVILSVLLSSLYEYDVESAVYNRNPERLHASHHFYPGYVPSVFGPYGQDCTPDSGDFPDKCKKPGDTLLQNKDGKIQCIHNFDCCACGAMICTDCVTLDCNGDSSCYGARNIQLQGPVDPPPPENPAHGTDIVCNGDLSCMETGMIGTDIAAIICSGDGACAYSKFHLSCKKSGGGCPFRCVGDNACQGDQFGDPAYAAEYVIANSNGLFCAARACKYGLFNMLSNMAGAVTCGAQKACYKSQITINNIDGVSCGGIEACRDSSMLIVNPQDSLFGLECNAAYSCTGINIEIIITDPLIESLWNIGCGGPYSCENATISIQKIVTPQAIAQKGGSADLVIGELTCGAARACKNTIFDLSPTVKFDHCGCAGTACDGLMGVDSCNVGLTKMECAGTACANKQESITNPADYFELICNGPGACENFVLTITINTAANAPSLINGVQCNGPHACRGLRLFIINEGTARIPCGSVNCADLDSCANSAFVLRNADFTSISCVPGACDQCAWFTDNAYQPC